MNTSAKLAAYGGALVLALAGTYAIGSAVGPLDVAGATSAAAGSAPAGDGAEGASHGDSHGGAVAASTQDLPGGLASSRDGYTLTVPAPTRAPGTTDPFVFQIDGPYGTRVTEFDVEHEKRMHLIVVRRDTTAFQHVHPEMSEDGTWRVPLDLTAGGTYRVFADFAPTGAGPITLGTDVAVPGQYEPVTHEPSHVSVVDGYEVTLDGELTPGTASPVTLTIRKDGAPVTDLQPYLGAYGHLVALREGDLAYLHVHPEGTPGDGKTPPGPAVEFAAEVPSQGTYRLFLDFQHDGVVRTADFTLSTHGH